ncbi:MAG TPA: VWA domain-containing protein [Candidatus Binataceae bacterium]|nr:VWA domain-containing protein [Candidatus Binataceae bacterium]
MHPINLEAISQRLRLPPIMLSLPHHIVLGRPEAFYLLPVIGLLLIVWLVQARTSLRFIAPLLRALVLALFVIALADPRTVMRSEGAARPVMIDASASITPAMRAFTISLLKDQLKLRASDPAIVFAGAPIAQDTGAATAMLENPAGCAPCDPSATNLEAALNRIAASGDTRGGSVVLVTDGWQNRGDAERALAALRAAGISLDIFTPPGARSVPNVAMTQLEIPPALEKAEPFSLGVTMANFNAVPAAGTITLYRNGQLIETHQVTIQPGQTRYDFPVHADSPGLVGFRAIFKSSDPALDAYPEDDALEGWVGIGGQRKVLILTDSARDSSYLASVASSVGLQPSVEVASGEWNGSFKGYDAVILNNVASGHIAPAAQNALVQYVADGGSLAMAGGDQSFGLGGWQNSPVAHIMPVLMKPPERRERKRALILIIDKSGSMGRNQKLEYAKAAALTVTKTMKDSDLLGVIGFDSQPFVVIPLEPMSESRPYFNELISRLKARGTTFLLPALQEAERDLAGSNAALKHIVILTDGETGGTAAMYYDLVSSMHHEGGVTISTIAIGQEANIGLLQSISRYGGGGFYQTDSPENLPALFLQDVGQRGGDTTMAESKFTPYSVSPDPLLKDLAGRQLPPIKGFVATQLKPGAMLSVFVNSNQVRAPILASWKYGAGKVIAVTTDASGRWSAAWIGSGIFSQLWHKLVTWMTPETPAAEKFAIAMGYRAGRISLNLTDYSDDPRSVGRPVNAAITAPNGARFDATLAQQAPGELAASFAASQPGTYYIALKSSQGGGQAFPPLAYTVSPALNKEMPQPAPNYALLEHLAAATGGRLNPMLGEAGAGRPEAERVTSLSAYCIVAAMILLIAEALVRRLTF